MPKDEFDPDDPMELCGVGFFTEEDTTDAMAECFVEEFLRLGYNHQQVFALFRNPFYIGMNMVLQNKGEEYVRNKIAEVYARWGKAVAWPAQEALPLTPALSRRERQDRPPCGGEASAAKAPPAFDTLLPLPAGEGRGEGERGVCPQAQAEAGQLIEFDTTATDPTGAPIPKLEL
ncbi:MAG: hypothetical protein HY735_13460 [Verrucomicrobia bacterium]|nr:hypothetical protein [Verrucomicrobiota bacterium]